MQKQRHDIPWIKWAKGVIDGTIIPLPRVKAYSFKPVNTICDSENLKQKLGKVCRFPPPPSTKKKDIGIH